jgi:hypothetical protein
MNSQLIAPAPEEATRNNLGTLNGCYVRRFCTAPARHLIHLSVPLHRRRLAPTACASALQVPCLLNILGAILYLRIGFSVGMMGMVGTLGIFGVSQGIAYLTISSFSAIVTNGRMKGGGAYLLRGMCMP